LFVVETTQMPTAPPEPMQQRSEYGDYTQHTIQDTAQQNFETQHNWYNPTPQQLYPVDLTNPAVVSTVETPFFPNQAMHKYPPHAVTDHEIKEFLFTGNLTKRKMKTRTKTKTKNKQHQK
jgi:hypothetical protein